MGDPHMSSKRKIEANRRNASKSTGPRTPEGKARVSRNPVTSGLCSRKVLLPDETLESVRAQFKALRKELKPQGAEEETLVVLIARDLRKLARHDRLEAGVLRWHHIGILVERARRRVRSRGIAVETSCRPRDRHKYERAKARVKRIRARHKRSVPTMGLAFIRGSQGGDTLSKLARYGGAIERSLLRNLEALQRRQQARRGGRRRPPSGSNSSGSGGTEGEPANPGAPL